MASENARLRGGVKLRAALGLLPDIVTFRSKRARTEHQVVSQFSHIMQYPNLSFSGRVTIVSIILGHVNTFSKCRFFGTCRKRTTSADCHVSALKWSPKRWKLKQAAWSWTRTELSCGVTLAIWRCSFLDHLGWISIFVPCTYSFTRSINLRKTRMFHSNIQCSRIQEYVWFEILPIKDNDTCRRQDCVFSTWSQWSVCENQVGRVGFCVLQTNPRHL